MFQLSSIIRNWANNLDKLMRKICIERLAFKQFLHVYYYIMSIYVPLDGPLNSNKNYNVIARIF
jgi:hypothetical protein